MNTSVIDKLLKPILDIAEGLAVYTEEFKLEALEEEKKFKVKRKKAKEKESYERGKKSRRKKNSS